MFVLSKFLSILQSIDKIIVLKFEFIKIFYIYFRENNKNVYNSILKVIL